MKCLALLLALGACAPQAASDEHGTAGDLVVITVSGLRRDHVGAYGYYRDTTPNLDRLATESLLFGRMGTSMPALLPAHMALWTGRHPLRTGVVSNDSTIDVGESLLLAEALSAVGFETAAFVGASVLSIESGIRAGFDHFVGSDEGRRRAYQTTRDTLAWISARTSDKPLFLWVHYADVLPPYHPPANHKLRFQGGPELTEHLKLIGLSNIDDPDVRRAHDGYDGELHYVDSEIGRLLVALRVKLDWDEASIVITSDHGMGLGQHSFLRQGRLHEEHLAIPFVWKAPGSAGLKVGMYEQWMDLSDVVPTLLGVLPLELDARFTGGFTGANVLDPSYTRSSLVAGSSRKDKGKSVTPSFVLREVSWKLYVDPGRAPRLFELDPNAYELSPAGSEQEERLERMRSVLSAEMERLSGAD